MKIELRKEFLKAGKKRRLAILGLIGEYVVIMITFWCIYLSIIFIMVADTYDTINYRPNSAQIIVCGEQTTFECDHTSILNWFLGHLEDATFIIILLSGLFSWMTTLDTIDRWRCGICGRYEYESDMCWNKKKTQWECKSHKK
jgi:hypothetical protein